MEYKPSLVITKQVSLMGHNFANCCDKKVGVMTPLFTEKCAIITIKIFIDFLGDGTVGLTEFRVDCVNRMAYKSIGELDAAYEKLLNVRNYYS